ncbi:MAG: phosphate ABC transporter permease PstA [Rhodobacteraceae bacterium]|nr:phosphate ABC transporter permease PstA [Paracoccaceae bacterium]
MSVLNTSDLVKKSLVRRNRRQILLQGFGIMAVFFAFLMLFLLISSLAVSGFKSLTQTHIEFTVYVDPILVDKQLLPRGNFKTILVDSLAQYLPEVESSQDKRQLGKLLSNGAQFTLRDKIVANPDIIGTSIQVKVPTSDPYDQFQKNTIKRDTPEEFRRIKDNEIAWFDSLKEQGLISNPLNRWLITNADSRFPELAGLKGALLGSFWALLVCFLISFPLGIGAAIYLEEFAPKNRVSNFIEVNINNLAAVPSVVFGLLALAVFIGWFGLPRSAPLVGGMALALMTMPTIIIATRAALKAIPPSIREAALGVGASQQQVVFGHVLPLAMPGILTGTIIGLAQALGETAPLLLIGMNAFITSAPGSPLDTATSLPTQIFIWADSPERGFVSRTSAAILVLLMFLISMNALAIFLRNRFERNW